MGYLKRYGDRKYRIQYDVAPVRGERRLKRETLEGVTKKQAEAILAQREAAVLAQRKTQRTETSPRMKSYSRTYLTCS